MSVTFTKLFTSITESTVWQEDDHTRIVWITMLAMVDRNGRVFASIPGLASRARVPVESAEKALRRFLSPDKYSRTPDNEGRRIEAIDGGWRLLNHTKYREIRDEESIKASKRKYINERRRKEREAKAVDVELNVEKVEHSRPNAEADTDAASEAIKSTRIVKRGHPKMSSPKHDFKKSSTSFSAKKQAHDFLRQLEEECNSERKDFILRFNALAASHPHMLLPVDDYTKQLDKALDNHENDGFEELLNTIYGAIKNFDGEPHKRLTLVRLAWENY